MADDFTTTADAGGPPTGVTFRAPEISSKKYQAIAKALINAAGTAFTGWEQGNEELAAILASAARTTTTTSSAQTSPSHRGAYFFIDVTASTSTKTLSLKIQGKDPVSGNYVDLYDFGVVVTSVGSAITVACLLHPNANDTDFAGAKALIGPLPATWKAVVTPSDATSWTYSLGAVGLR